MEDDMNKIYDAIFKMSKKLAEMDQRNQELEEIVSKFGQNRHVEEEQDPTIIDQENYLVDPHAIGGHKNLSLPNGGSIRLKSQPLCINGRHIIKDSSEILFCSKCSSIFCTGHSYESEDPTCVNCLREEIRDFDSLSLYVMFALRNGIPLSKIKRRFNLSGSELSDSLSKLVSSGCVKRDMFFRCLLTITGEKVLNSACVLYDFDFLCDLKSG